MIRLWTLGNLEYGVIPTNQRLDRFKETLLNALFAEKRDGVVDIVWGPELQVQEVQNGDTVQHFVVEDMKVEEDNLYITAKKVK